MGVSISNSIQDTETEPALLAYQTRNDRHLASVFLAEAGLVIHLSVESFRWHITEMRLLGLVLNRPLIAKAR